MTHAAILVIAKAPVPGRVKTRLCPPCTVDEAAAIAEAALHDTLAAVAGAATRRIVVLDGQPGDWLPPGFDIVRQVEGSLDARLEAAFGAVEGRAFLVGMDTPQITSRLLDAAIDTLDRRRTDAVLGLAADGGWWGIGLRRPDGRVFQGVEMSTGTTGACQRRRLRELGLRTRLLEELRDVDHFDDALAVARAIPGSLFASTVAAVDAGCRTRALALEASA